MAVRFFTSSSTSLLKTFDEKIAQKERQGSITTWEKSSSGNYTHISERWGKKAYFKARHLKDRLVFNMVPVVGTRIEPEVYAYYHSHLIETFINHFAENFTVAAATPKPTEQDKLVSSKA